MEERSFEPYRKVQRDRRFKEPRLCMSAMQNHNGRGGENWAARKWARIDRVWVPSLLLCGKRGSAAKVRPPLVGFCHDDIWSIEW